MANSLRPLPKYIHAPPEYKKDRSLEHLSLRVQEALIIEDLLYVLLGCEGTYICFGDTYDPSIQFDRLKGPDFRFNKSIPINMQSITESVCELACHNISLCSFVDLHSKPEYGQVNQALCASIRKYLQDYTCLISQLETELFYNKSFSLQTFLLQIQPTAHLFKQLYDLAQSILNENAQKSEDVAAAYNNNDFEKIFESLKEVDGAKFPDLDLGFTGRASKSTVCKGGSILRILAEKLVVFSGDPATSGLLKTLLKDASIPYLKMLKQWIHKGVIFDPYDEFLIREQKSIKRDKLQQDYTDEYWDKRYTVRKGDLPLQLSDPEVYERILLTGKYLNVVRECGGIDASKEDTTVYESIEDSRFLISLAQAYNHANETLLSLLINTHELPARLRSLKHYFFLDQADFFINFMDIARDELMKPSRQASKTKLQYLLDMSLRQPGSISSTDPFRDEVIVDISHTSVTDYLLKIVNVTGMNPKQALGLASAGNLEAVEKLLRDNDKGGASSVTVANNSKSVGPSKSFAAIFGLQLDFNIPFPLSLVLSRKTILRYQLMFRHLVELKHIERMLDNSWVSQVKSKVWRHVSDNQELEEWKKRATRLRSKMLLFIQQVLYYFTLEVIEPNWGRFQDRLYEAKNADLLMAQHVYFLDTCMKESMLTNEKLLRVQMKLFTACRLLGEYMLQREKSIVLVDSDMLTDQEKLKLKLKRPNNKNGEEMTAEELVMWLNATLSQYESRFDHHLKILIEALNYYAATETTAFLSLSSQLEVALFQN